MAVAGIVLLATAVLRTIAHIFRHVARGLVPAASRYVKWFWRLPIGAKIAATVAEVIAVQLAMSFAPLGAFERHELVVVIAFGLVGLMLAGILFGSVGARAR
jgi:hypothetical protein